VPKEAASAPAELGSLDTCYEARLPIITLGNLTKMNGSKEAYEEAEPSLPTNDKERSRPHEGTG
jgi:hypothetical protein